VSTPDGLVGIASRVLERARSGEQVEIYASRGTSTSVRAYNGEVEAFTQASSAGIGVRVVIDGRQGFASAGSLDRDVVALLLDEARDNATFAQPDDANGLATPVGAARDPLDLWCVDVVERDADWKIAQAVALEAQVRGADPRIVGVRAASYSDSIGERAIVSNMGVEVHDRGTFASLSVSALAKDESGTTTGGGATYGRSTHDLDPDVAAVDAVRRATECLGATKPDTTRLTIVLEPRIAATLLGLIGSMLSGSAVLKGRSLFAGRIGEQIASPLLSVWDDPTDVRSFGADSHDGEGLVCRRVPLVEAGVLSGYLHNSYTARRLGTLTTASAARGARSTPGVGAAALHVAPGAGTLEQLIASVDHGLFVTSMSGLHSGVNTVSGDFSVGVEGLMIRHGALAEPIREATLGSTLPRLLTGISAVGADLEWQPSGTGAVSLVIADVMLSGV
jgi:PmbA protein